MVWFANNTIIADDGCGLCGEISANIGGSSPGFRALRAEKSENRQFVFKFCLPLSISMYFNFYNYKYLHVFYVYIHVDMICHMSF